MLKSKNLGRRNINCIAVKVTKKIFQLKVKHYFSKSQKIKGDF